MPTEKTNHQCFLCKCGMSLWGPWIEISEAWRELWSSEHSGAGHGPCSYMEYMLLGRGYVAGTSAFVDFYGKDWTKERNAPGQGN